MVQQGSDSLQPETGKERSLASVERRIPAVRMTRGQVGRVVREVQSRGASQDTRDGEEVAESIGA